MPEEKDNVKKKKKGNAKKKKEGKEKKKSSVDTQKVKRMSHQTKATNTDFKCPFLFYIQTF